MSEAEAQAETKAEGQRKERRGVVVSDKMTKTVVVAVERRIKHRKYKKYINLQKRYAAHDELGVQVGDIVRIRETRPMSKRKRWQVVEKLSRDA